MSKQEPEKGTEPEKPDPPVFLWGVTSFDEAGFAPTKKKPDAAAQGGEQ